MKTIKNLTAVMALAFIASCNNNETIKPEKVESSTSVVEATKGDNSRIINYKIDKTKTKAFTTEMVEPTVPYNANLMHITYESWNVKDDSSYVLEAGESLTTDINYGKNVSYYVKGNLTVTGAWGKGAIYVLEGGSLNYKVSTLADGQTIENFGTLTLPNNKFTINKGATVATNKPLKADEFQVGGTLFCGSHAEFKDFHIIDNGSAFFTCCIHSSNEVKLYKGEMHIGKYLKAKSLFIDQVGSLDFDGEALLECETINLNTSNDNSSSKIVNNGDKYAVIKCNELIVHQSNQKYINGFIDIHAGEIRNNSGRDLEWLSSIKFNDDTYIPELECRPGFGEKPEDNTPPKIVINPVGEVMPHSERISATSIDFAGGNAFVSWHLAGAEYRGFIDLIKMEDLAVLSTFESADMDFNHIYVAGDKIYSAGANKVGAFIADVTYQNAIGSIDIEVKKINGASGNSVVLNSTDNNMWAISGANGGVSVINSNNEVKFNQLLNAKYVVNNNQNMTVLAGNNEGSAIYNYNAQGDVVNSFQVDALSPIDGKNTLAVDGETIYVALGNNGVKAYVNGVQTLEFREEEQGSANCVTFDEKYVYIANGTNGFVVLNKTDFSLVARHKVGGASANFVKKGDNGLLYVAYGLKGVNVYELTEVAQ